MRNRRFEFSNRRHQIAMPRVPFKDSNGATITESRRKIPDRRLCNMQAELADEQERGRTMASTRNMNVEPEVVNNTQCDMNYICLSGRIVCNVEPYLERDVQFLRCMEQRSCAFKKSFKRWFTCACPVNVASYSLN